MSNGIETLNGSDGGRTAGRGPILTQERLDHLAAMLRSAPSRQLVAHVFEAAELDRQLLRDVWSGHAAKLFDSPLAELLLEDPYSRHARLKPRGYAGDAGLLDRIYFGLDEGYEHGCSVSKLGDVIHAETIRRPGADAVRVRRRLLAKIVDLEATRQPKLRVASIACGYVREARLSRALASGRVSCWTCLDQDRESIRQVAFTHEGDPAVVPVRADIADLIAERLVLEPHDLIYSAGLYDYLDAESARRLTRTLFDALTPGGRLVIGNFAVGLPERGYMEAFVDWRLIYRTRTQVERFADGIPRQQLRHLEVATCHTGWVHYLDLRKA